MNCIECGVATEGSARFCPSCRAGFTAPAQAVEAPKPRVRIIWFVLVAVALIGAYAAMLLPAKMGQAPDNTDTVGAMLWTGLLFYLAWKHLGKTPWHGGALGAGLGFLVVILASMMARGASVSAAPMSQTDTELLAALAHFDPAGAENVRRAWPDKARVQRVLQPLLKSALPTASDEAILALADVQQRAFDPEIPGRVSACSDAARGRPPSFVGSLLPEEERALTSAMAQIFQTADAKRTPPVMDKESLQRAVGQVLVQVDPEGTLQNPERLNALPEHEQCRLYRGLMSGVRATPEAASVMRFSMMSR